MIIRKYEFCEKLYLISLSLTIVMYMFTVSVGFNSIYYKYFLYFLRFSAYVLLLIKLLYDLIYKTFSLKEIIFFSFIGFFLLLIVYQSRIYGHFIYYIYIIASKNVNYRKIILTALLSHIFAAIIIVSCSLIGVMPDIIFSKGIRNRHSLGFNWCTHLVNFYMYMVLYIIYIRRDKMKIFEYLLILIIDIVLYFLTDTKSGCAFVILALLLSYILSNIKYLQKFNSFYKEFIYFLIISLPVLIILTSYLYNDNGIFILLNRILNGRLSLGHNAIEQYGISLLAKRINFIGGEVDSSMYNYVDSSFLKYLINFGIINFILIMVLIVNFANRIIKNKDVYLFICFIIFMIHSTFDPQLLLIEFNDFFLCLGL